MQNSAVPCLCCTVLCCAVLCCAVLCCARAHCSNPCQCRKQLSRCVLVQAMAESLTPKQGVDAKEREGMLKRIAKLAKHQGSFHLACKKYTQVRYSMSGECTQSFLAHGMLPFTSSHPASVPQHCKGLLRIQQSALRPGLVALSLFTATQMRGFRKSGLQVMLRPQCCWCERRQGTK